MPKSATRIAKRNNRHLNKINARATERNPQIRLQSSAINVKRSDERQNKVNVRDTGRNPQIRVKSTKRG